MIVLTQITDCIFLSLFWMVGYFPLVTFGASTAALYDAAFRSFRAGEKNFWQRFWQVFRRNWKAGIVPSILFLLLVFGLGKGMIQVWHGGPDCGSIRTSLAELIESDSAIVDECVAMINAAMAKYCA